MLGAGMISCARPLFLAVSLEQSLRDSADNRTDDEGAGKREHFSIRIRKQPQHVLSRGNE